LTSFFGKSETQACERLSSRTISEKILLHGVKILSALLVWMNLGLHAEQVNRTISQFVHTNWSAKDGAPGDVYALAQTTNGSQRPSHAIRNPG
jgi:hypothetical protein